MASAPAQPGGGAGDAPITDAELYGGAQDELDEKTAVTDRTPPREPVHYLARASVAVSEGRRSPRDQRAYWYFELQLELGEHPSVPGVAGTRISHYMSTAYIEKKKTTSVDDFLKVMTGKKGHGMNHAQKRDAVLQLLAQPPMVGFKLDWRLSKSTGKKVAGTDRDEYQTILWNAENFVRGADGKPSWSETETRNPGARTQERISHLLPAPEVQQLWQQGRS
jgi:hypothetical protein